MDRSSTSRVGILFSSTGSYGAVGRTMLNGALLAIGETNDDEALGLALEPVLLDPGGDLANYGRCAEALTAQGIRHVVGCYTSSSRKEVIPIFEKRDALLWYPAHYEGFESSENVVYTGSAPNQHLLPLIDFLTQRFGGRAFCIGSNYIWAWESNRVLRDELAQRGGVVLAERYLAVGDTEMAHLVEAIIEAKPDFVFNSLIGESAYSFFRAFRRECERRGIDQAERFPVASCNLSEPELLEIGERAIEGHLSSSVYFASIGSTANRSFTSSYEARFGAGPVVSAEAEAAYIAVKFLAAAISAAGSEAIEDVKAALAGRSLAAPQGKVSIDRDTLHTWLTPRIGRSRRDGGFDILMEAKGPVRPDPYLVHSSSAIDQPLMTTPLRVVR